MDFWPEKKKKIFKAGIPLKVDISNFIYKTHATAGIPLGKNAKVMKNEIIGI